MGNARQDEIKKARERAREAWQTVRDLRAKEAIGPEVRVAQERMHDAAMELLLLISEAVEVLEGGIQRNG